MLVRLSRRTGNQKQTPAGITRQGCLHVDKERRRSIRPVAPQGPCAYSEAHGADFLSITYARPKKLAARIETHAKLMRLDGGCSNRSLQRFRYFRNAGLLFCQ
jgi:hypothetical protein